MYFCARWSDSCCRMLLNVACIQVRECLMFSAQLRLPGDMTTADKKNQVDNILEELV